jgi:hypothetical protein
MKNLFLFFIIFNFLIIDGIAWEKVPVPDYVDKQTLDRYLGN